MSVRFFNPWVGDHYYEGVGSNAYHVLILGASVYCTFNGLKNERCPHFDECTDEDTQDSSAFNDCCPHPDHDDDGQALMLEDSPANWFRGPKKRFAKKMENRFGYLLDENPFWDCVAFAEYVQFYLPHQETYPSNLSDRDFDAFLETLDELQPEVVIVWGDTVPNALRDSDYTVDAEDDKPWSFSWEYNGMFIRFICCTHPAARGCFYHDFPDFARRFEETVCSYEDEDDDDKDDEFDEGDYDEDDDDRVYLETAGDLLERLNDLPRKCNNFIVRSRDVDDDNWVQPELWYIDDDGDLVLGLYDDGEDYHEYTVSDLKEILRGDVSDNNCNTVEDETSVLIDRLYNDGYYTPLDDWFHINWKKKRVVIPVSIDDEDEDEDYYDEENEEEDENNDETDSEDNGNGERIHANSRNIGDNLTLRLLLTPRL